MVITAKVGFEPDYFFGDSQQVSYCNAWNLGAQYAVQAWNKIMLHQSSRITLAFIFPILVATIAKKHIDELWDSFKKKN